MTGQALKTWRIVPIMLATAALGFGQANGVSDVATTPPDYAHQQYPATRRAEAPQQAQPGNINYVEGQVSIDGRPLSPNSVGAAALEPGQVLDTQNGFVEVLLTPGAFLRVGHNSEVRMNSVGLANTSLQVTRGSALIEADELINGTNVNVAVGNAKTHIEKKGLYGFDADQQTVRVLDGKLVVTQADRSKTLGRGDQILLSTMKKTDFDRKAAESETLYVWSRARSASEAQVNAGEAYQLAAYGGPYVNGWYWNPYWSSYAFVPGAGFLYSPFGFGFYSPAYFYGGFYGPRYYGARYYGGHYYGHVAGFSGGIHASGFGGGFHGGHR